MISSVSTTIWNHKALSHFYGHFVVSKSGKCLVEQDFICSLPSYGNILGMHLIKENQTFYSAFLCVKVPKYGVFCGLYFPVLGLNTEIYGVQKGEHTDQKKLLIWTCLAQCSEDIEAEHWLEMGYAVIVIYSNFKC